MTTRRPIQQSSLGTAVFDFIEVFYNRQRRTRPWPMPAPPATTRPITSTCA
jgi:hypothetical protein